MNKKIKISVNEKVYLIEIEPNSFKKKIENIIKKNNNVIFLIDKKVFNSFQKVKNFKNQKYISISCSEKIKSFQYYSKICNKIYYSIINLHFGFVHT